MATPRGSAGLTQWRTGEADGPLLAAEVAGDPRDRRGECLMPIAADAIVLDGGRAGRVVAGCPGQCGESPPQVWQRRRHDGNVVGVIRVTLEPRAPLPCSPYCAICLLMA